ncbi:MAG: NADP oxidoreductase [Desulfomonilaceae bacterium]
MSKIRLATTWLDGCSGCHMSLLDIDEKIIELASLIDVVYSPLVDVKEFPDDVDVTLVEGAISSDADVEEILNIRKKTKLLISFGDCAVSANVPAMRNRFDSKDVLARAYIENATNNKQIPYQNIPRLQSVARPVHEFVQVDVFLQGCPPPAEAIYSALSQLLAGEHPNLAGKTRFGA